MRAACTAVGMLLATSQASGFVPLPGITGGPSRPAEGLHESLAAKTNCRYPPNEPCEASGRCRVDGQRCSIRKSLANAISSTHTALCADARSPQSTEAMIQSIIDRRELGLPSTALLARGEAFFS